MLVYQRVYHVISSTKTIVSQITCVNLACLVISTTLKNVKVSHIYLSLHCYLGVRETKKQ